MKRLTVLIILLVLTSLGTGSAATPPLPGIIVNDAFTVAAGQFVAYPIAVHPHGGRVYGKFRASGGGGNDIECFIVDEDGLENFGNGHSVPTYYKEWPR